jgi:hypothetical protein
MFSDRLLGQWLQNRRAGNGHVLFEQELRGVAALHDEWLSVAQLVTGTWLRWCTKGPAAQFVVDAWRPAFRRTSVADGPQCDVCGKSTRSQTYTCVAGSLPERTLTLCRICSTKSDLPSKFELSISLREIVHAGEWFRVLGTLENRSDSPALLSTAMFFMAANRVWPESVAQQEPVWIRAQQTLRLDLPTPQSIIQGDHWFVVIGLFDCAPFTYCTKVQITQNSGQETSLYPRKPRIEDSSGPGAQ